MNIVAADPHARLLSETEVLTLLREPIVMHLGLVDGKGWPLVNPVWHVFEGGVFRLIVGTDSAKATRLRADRRAYFAVDTGASSGSARGVRGRATAHVIDGNIDLAVDVCRKGLVKYTGSDEGPHAEELLKWARSGEMSVVELTSERFAAFGY
jgi:hypothetical protein